MIKTFLKFYILLCICFKHLLDSRRIRNKISRDGISSLPRLRELKCEIVWGKEEKSDPPLLLQVQQGRDYRCREKRVLRAACAGLSFPSIYGHRTMTNKGAKRNVPHPLQTQQALFCLWSILETLYAKSSTASSPSQLFRGGYAVVSLDLSVQNPHQSLRRL